MWLKSRPVAAAVFTTTPRSQAWSSSSSLLCVLKFQQQPKHQQFNAQSASVAAASFTTTATCQKIQYPPRPKPPPDEDITEVYLKGSGPGGQKINKTSSAVQLKHIPTGIVIKCQETRSRSQNRKLAREHLAEKIDDFLHGENSRSAVVARINARKKASAHKKSRRKHQAPGGGSQGEGDQDEGNEDQDEVGNMAQETTVDPIDEPTGNNKEPAS
ncbi:unnamed protein product [Discula destructiva]